MTDMYYENCIYWTDLDEAIEHYSRLADKCRREANIERNDYMDLKDLAHKYEQLADWLNERKVLREKLRVSLEKQERGRWHSVAKEGNPKKSGHYIVVDNSKMYGKKPHTRWFNAYGKEEFWSGWGADKVVAWKEITSEPYEEE